MTKRNCELAGFFRTLPKEGNHVIAEVYLNEWKAYDVARDPVLEQGFTKLGIPFEIEPITDDGMARLTLSFFDSWADKLKSRACSPDGGNIMTTGVVKRLVGEHGYGFVSSDAGKDIFFHYSQLQGIKFQSLKEGQTLIYKVGLGEKGFVAKDIKLYRIA